jgi:hypothetical protein
MTEFGRTFFENGNFGLDHGRASTMFVMGGGIRGGLYGDWPGLGTADIDRNGLRVTVDYRLVLADIVEHRLGNPALDQVLPGFVLSDDIRLNLAEPLVAPAIAPLAVPPVDVTTPAETVEPAVPEEGPAPVTAGPGTYVWTAPSGATVLLDVPAPADDADVTSVESVRVALGAPAATFVLARIDNTAGAEPLTVPTITVTNAAGAPLALRDASALLDEWIAAASGADTAAATELAAALRERTTAPAGGASRVVLAASGALTDIGAVRAGMPGSSVVLAQEVVAAPAEAAEDGATG